MSSTLEFITESCKTHPCPGVQMVAMDRGKYYVSGKLTGLNRPERDFFCKTPAETREDLPKGVDVVAFQCRNPIHRAHYEVGQQKIMRNGV